MCILHPFIEYLRNVTALEERLKGVHYMIKFYPTCTYVCAYIMCVCVCVF